MLPQGTHSLDLFKRHRWLRLNGRGAEDNSIQSVRPTLHDAETLRRALHC